MARKFEGMPTAIRIAALRHIGRRAHREFWAAAADHFNLKTCQTYPKELQ